MTVQTAAYHSHGVSVDTKIRAQETDVCRTRSWRISEGMGEQRAWAPQQTASMSPSPLGIVIQHMVQIHQGRTVKGENIETSPSNLLHCEDSYICIPLERICMTRHGRVTAPRGCVATPIEQFERSCKLPCTKIQACNCQLASSCMWHVDMCT